MEWGNEGVEARLASLCADAEDAVQLGYNILIVSDRKLDANNVAIPALLALSAIHQHLVTKGCAPVPVWWSKQAAHARSITSRCWPVTVPRRCIPTSPWKRC